MEQNLSWKVHTYAAVKKIRAFYGTRKLITAFTKSRHWSLFRAKLIPTPPPIYFKSILILSCVCACVFQVLKCKINLVGYYLQFCQTYYYTPIVPHLHEFMLLM
jgi:hypothetical protein